MIDSYESMKPPLPQSPTKAIVLFPSIFRFITEYSFAEAQAKNIKVILTALMSLFLLSIIFVEGVVLWHQLKQQQSIIDQRVQLQKEITYWEGVADKYKGYRDVYYRIASLQYKIGNAEAAQSYVKKALELDPNFPEGRVLGTKVGLK